MKFQKSKKDRICYLCDRKILRGERYFGEYNVESRQMRRQEHANCEMVLDKEHDPDD
jgi:hypothetical protein